MIQPVQNCLENIVGIRQQCEDVVAPTSGFYLQDYLEGVTLGNAAKIAKETELSGLELLQNLLRTATRTITDRIRLDAMPAFRLSNQLDASLRGQFTEEYNDYLNHELGVKICRIRGVKELQVMRIRKLQILAADTADVTLVIDDGAYGSTSYPISLVAGQIHAFEPNLICRSDSVTITLNSNDVRLSVVKRNNGWGYCNEWCGWGYLWDWFCSSNKLLVARGWDNTTKESTERFYGIIPDVALECDLTDFFCLFSEQLALPIIYEAGCRFLEKAFASTRVNEISEMSPATYEIRLHTWQQRREAAIKLALGTIHNEFKRVGKHNECVECTGLKYSQSF